jgi:hypothetical protein
MSEQLPVDSLRDALPFLRRPFTPEAVKFKIQSITKTDPPSGLVVAYIDARLAGERLNLVCPHLWHDEYVRTQEGGLLCKLTVDNVTRIDIGEGVGKALFSDAFKRAAVKFGVGVSLYAIPQSWVSPKSNTAKVIQTSKGPSLALTDNGTEGLRVQYRQWLDTHGAKAFGDPLDHGDGTEAVGDLEAAA